MAVIRKKKSFGKSLKAAAVKNKPSDQPLWKGPWEDGITQSLLNLFLICRERFRLKVIEGWSLADTFNHRLEYGSMWHVCEEEYARTKGADDNWQRALLDYCKGLSSRYKESREQILHWYNVCKLQFPIYLEHWKKHPDQRQKKMIYAEQTFSVPYRLPSGRSVRLRGKWDGVDWIGKGKAAGIYLQENKTKGEINEEGLKRQLSFDLQTMFYLTALSLWEEFPSDKLAGVRYNVIRRPLAGGKHSISQRKGRETKTGLVGAETPEEFYARLGEEIKGDPEFFFMRWTVEVSREDIIKFRRQFLDPILEQLCDWWEWIIAAPEGEFRPCDHGIHFRTPYGIYNPLAEGRTTDLDDYLMTGSTTGLVKADRLFKELD